MSALSGSCALLLQLCMPPFLVLLTFVLFLASFGKSLGIRRVYVRALVAIFEVGSKKVPEVHRPSPTLPSSRARSRRRRTRSGEKTQRPSSSCMSLRARKKKENRRQKSPTRNR